MSQYMLAAFDMDGTLLNSAKEIQPSAAAAFKRAIRAGRILALDTGRAVTELRQYPFTEMGVRYGACACGTVIYDFQENRVLAKKTIPAELIPRIVAASREEDLMFQAMVDGISYVEEASVKRMDHYQMGIYRPLYEETTSYAEDVRSFALAHADSINKINLYHTDPESRENLRAAGERLTLIGEPVTMGSLGAAIREKYGIETRIVCPTEDCQGLTGPGDVITRGEEEVLQALRDDKLVLADPMYEYVCPADCRLIRLSHLAFSGRTYRKEFRNLLTASHIGSANV